MCTGNGIDVFDGKFGGPQTCSATFESRLRNRYGLRLHYDCMPSILARGTSAARSLSWAALVRGGGSHGQVNSSVCVCYGADYRARYVGVRL